LVDTSGRVLGTKGTRKTTSVRKSKTKNALISFPLASFLPSPFSQQTKRNPSTHEALDSLILNSLTQDLSDNLRIGGSSSSSLLLTVSSSSLLLLAVRRLLLTIGLLTSLLLLTVRRLLLALTVLLRRRSTEGGKRRRRVRGKSEGEEERGKKTNP